MTSPHMQPTSWLCPRYGNAVGVEQGQGPADPTPTLLMILSLSPQDVLMKQIHKVRPWAAAGRWEGEEMARTLGLRVWSRESPSWVSSFGSLSESFFLCKVMVALPPLTSYSLAVGEELPSHPGLLWGGHRSWALSRA